MIVLMRGIAFVHFGTPPIGEKQIVDSFSTRHAIVDLSELYRTTTVKLIAGAA